MKQISMAIFFFLFILQLGVSQNVPKSNPALQKRIKSVKGLVALWDFKEQSGNERNATGIASFSLKESNGPVQRAEQGPLSGYSIVLNGENYLSLPHAETGDLNIYGKDSQVTVIAWVKWAGTQTGFIGGMWNESSDGGKRQYGLFVSLPYYNGGNQVCGHISKTGKASPPFPYSIDYSASKQKVVKDEWCCVAFTYDGNYIKSYFNGKFEARMPELIHHTKGFEGYPDGLTQIKNPYYFPDGIGDNGSDFTVGAVQLKNGMGNNFMGLIGGLVVYRRALSENEIHFIVNGSD